MKKKKVTRQKITLPFFECCNDLLKFTSYFPCFNPPSTLYNIHRSANKLVSSKYTSYIS